MPGMRTSDFFGGNELIKVVGAVQFAICLIMSVGCTPAEDTAYLTPVSEETLSAYNWGSPVDNKLDAVIVGRLLLGDSRMVEVETPQVLYAVESSRNEAMNQLYNTSGVQYDIWPAEQRVWLVIFKGNWHILAPPDPTGPSEPILFQGCAYALFMAADAEPISSGGAKCPP